MRDVLVMVPVLALAVTCSCESVLVSVQSQTEEDMNALTAQVDAAAQGLGPARVTLGAIEATMSRVVDVEDPYLVTVPQSVRSFEERDRENQANNTPMQLLYGTRVEVPTVINPFNPEITELFVGEPRAKFTCGTR